MTYRSGFSDFFHEFRGQECIITFCRRDPGDWWISPLLADGEEGEAFQDLSQAEDDALAIVIENWRHDQD
jgi:hypothetical protein